MTLEKKAKGPVYVAIFLDEESKAALLKAFPPKHVNVYGEHMTLAFGRHMEPTYPLGEEFELVVLASYEDARGQAVTVKGIKANQWIWVDQIPHITISCAVGIKPMYSNDLIRGPMQPGDPELIIRPDHNALKLKGILDYFPRTPKEAPNAVVPLPNVG